jgi:Cft2 family RNA processing exonuclease
MKNKKKRFPNQSSKLINGTILRTRDKYLPGGASSYHEKEEKHKNKNDLYRKVIIIDTNRKNEIAILELTSDKRGILINPKENDRSRCRPFITRTFSDKKPLILISSKLERSRNDASYSPGEALALKKYCLKSNKVTSEQKEKIFLGSGL